MLSLELIDDRRHRTVEPGPAPSEAADRLDPVLRGILRHRLKRPGAGVTMATEELAHLRDLLQQVASARGHVLRPVDGPRLRQQALCRA